LQFNDLLLVCVAMPLPGVKQQYKVKAKLDISGMKVCTCHITSCPLLYSRLLVHIFVIAELLVTNSVWSFI